MNAVLQLLHSQKLDKIGRGPERGAQGNIDRWYCGVGIEKEVDDSGRAQREPVSREYHRGNIDYP